MKMTEFVTPQLRTVLKTYQNSATKSLQGPGQSLAAAAAAALHNNNSLSPGNCIKKEYVGSPELLDDVSGSGGHGGHSDHSQSVSVPPPPPPELPQPILTAPDTGRGVLYETILEGKPIGCFLLGGEMRLCLPQFLNNVLTDFTLDQINRIFDELRIFCSQCTPEQLMEFKAAKILPEDVKASGLITRTNAERLCSALLSRSQPERLNAMDIPKGAISFKVYHRCFGKCEGICTPDLYAYTKPVCIMCLECNGMFSPQKFVGHVHRQAENRTCHWGFDSRNWRDYLHVAIDVENREKYGKMLDDLRDLEQQDMMYVAQRDSSMSTMMSCLKRKAEMMEDSILPTASVPATTTCKREPIDIPTKKSKLIDEAYLLDYQRYHQALFYAQCAQREQQLSAFRPWAPKPSILHLPYSSVAAAAAAAAASLPYLSQEPPILQNPERVVRHTECERFERTFQPNVALAPRKSILSKERERERGRERLRDGEQRERERDRSTKVAITNSIETINEIHIKQERTSSPDVALQSPEEMRIASPNLEESNIHPNRISCNNDISGLRGQQLNQQLLHNHQQQHHLNHLNKFSHHQQKCTTTSTSSSSSTPPSKVATIPPPISPEEFSGSNEITSSTSPVPNTNVNSRLSNATPTPIALTSSTELKNITPQHQGKLMAATSIIASGGHLQKTGNSDELIVCSPTRLHINNTIQNNSNLVRSPTPPSIQKQYTVNHSSKAHNPNTNNINNKIVHQQQSTLSSSVVNFMGRNDPNFGVLVKNLSNGIAALSGNSEFELSTDTDDDSLNGEPDSSQVHAPWEIAADALKDTRPVDRERVLHLIKILLHENAQLRQLGIENARLIQQLGHRDEQISELNQELQHHQRQLALLSPQSSHSGLSSILDHQQTTSIKSNGSVFAKTEMCEQQQEIRRNSLSNINDICSPIPLSKQQYHQMPELEKIKVPLKKSLRRSPEEISVVVINQNMSSHLQQQRTSDEHRSLQINNNTSKANDSKNTIDLSLAASSQQQSSNNNSAQIATSTMSSLSLSSVSSNSSASSSSEESTDSIKKFDFETPSSAISARNNQQNANNNAANSIASIKCE